MKQWALFSLVLLLSCSAGKGLRTGKESAPAPGKVVEMVSASRIHANWFNGKAKITYSDKEQSMGATVTIRMKKDSVLWLSIRKFGFEAARALITADSVFVLNRIDQEVSVGSIAAVEKLYNIPADLALIQDLVLGNPVFLEGKNIEVHQEEGLYRLSSSHSGRQDSYWIDPTHFFLHKMHLMEDAAGRRTLILDQKNQKDLGDGQFFAYLRLMNFSGQSSGTVDIQIDFSEVAFNESDIKFDIPDRYERVEMD